MSYNEGKIIKAAIKKSGHSVTLVSKHLGVSRNTVYNLFNKNHVKDGIIIKLRSIIDDDLLKELSYMQRIDRKIENDSNNLEQKYLNVLERYNTLLNYLVIITNENSLYTFKKLISDFINK